MATYSYVEEQSTSYSSHMLLNGIHYSNASSNIVHEGGEPLKLRGFWIEQITPIVDIEFFGKPQATSLTFTQTGGTKTPAGVAVFDPDHKVTATFDVDAAQKTHYVLDGSDKQEIIRDFAHLRAAVYTWDYGNVGDRDFIVDAPDIIGYVKTLTGDYRNGWQLIYKQEMAVNYSAGENGTTTDALSETVLFGEMPASIPNITANDGYGFVGWALEGTTELVDPATMAIEENMTFVAQYKELKGTVEVTVVDKDDNSILLEGATVRLELVDKVATKGADASVKADFVGPAMEQATDVNGTALYENVPAGEYKVTQLSTIDGYIKWDGEMTIVVTGEEDVPVVALIQNEKIPATPEEVTPADPTTTDPATDPAKEGTVSKKATPKTGDESMVGFMTALLLLGGIACLGLARRKIN